MLSLGCAIVFETIWKQWSGTKNVLLQLLIRVATRIAWEVKVPHPQTVSNNNMIALKFKQCTSSANRSLDQCPVHSSIYSNCSPEVSSLEIL